IVKRVRAGSSRYGSDPAGWRIGQTPACTAIARGGRMPDDHGADSSPDDGSDGRASVDSVLPELYTELRTLARQRLRRSPRGQSLNTTGLVHEAYLRLIESVRTSFQNREHFLAVSSRVM